MPVGAQSGFDVFMQQVIVYGGAFVQIAYAVGMLTIAALAYRQFRRLVDARVASLSGVGAPDGRPATPAGDLDVSVDEFVD